MAKTRGIDPARKRRIRLVVALSAALLLAGALVYTSFSAATDAVTPSQLLAASATGKAYQVTGKVAYGSVHRSGDTVRFRIRDRKGGVSVPVTYTGAIPDPFREGREVIVSGHMRNGTFVGERDSLITKCPSKFKNAPSGRPA
jgi:cytochrome c-type biogenesis protein CcmE